MALSPLTPPPPAPQIDDEVEEFDAHSFGMVDWYATAIAELNVLIAWLNTNIGAYSVVTKTGTSESLLESDIGKYARFTNSSAKSYAVNELSLTGNPIFNLRNVGAGDLTLVPAGGITINLPPGGSLVMAQGSTASLVYISATEYDLIGQTVPA